MIEPINGGPVGMLAHCSASNSPETTLPFINKMLARLPLHMYSPHSKVLLDSRGSQ
jgi:hypothetical protein